MITSFQDIPFDSIKDIDKDGDQLLREHLGIGFSECAQALCQSLQQRADELLPDFTNLAPHGDYGKLTEDPAVIVQFLRHEAAKPEHWKIQYIEVKKDKDQLMELVFFNSAVDDGDILKGFVFLGLSGKIRHAFVQVHS